MLAKREWKSLQKSDSLARITFNWIYDLNPAGLQLLMSVDVSRDLGSAHGMINGRFWREAVSRADGEVGPLRRWRRDRENTRYLPCVCRLG
jgi:hypothetical protein